MKILQCISIVSWSLLLVSCNLPKREKLSNLQTRTEGIYSFPFTRIDYNVNQFLLDEYLTYRMGDIFYRTPASDYARDLNRENYQRDIVLSNMVLTVEMANSAANQQIEIDQVSLLAGKLRLSMQYTSTINARAQYIIEDLEDNLGNTFSRTIDLPIGDNRVITEEVDVSGYVIRPQVEKNDPTDRDKITRRFLRGRRTIVGTVTQNIPGNLIIVNIEQQVVEISDVQVDFVEGKFGNYKTDIATRVLSLANVLNKSPKEFTFGERHRIQMTFVNPFSIPIYIELKDLSVNYVDGTSQAIDFTTLIDGRPARNTIKLDADPTGSSFVTRTVVIDDDTSPNLATALSGELNRFAYVSVSISAEINPLPVGVSTAPKIPGRITGRADLSAIVSGDIALSARVN